ncbi:MAG: AraC family transcriptional regulator [Lachnospiraceae bacterium]|nr:AraC family transcriptional regulator [Lachnospiraceae bacterium]
MEKSIFMELQQNTDCDLYVSVFGHSVTEPMHKSGPSVRSFYLIHFILEGEGDFYVNNVHYHLHSGQGFLIEPDNQTTYISDQNNPWTYIWVGFSGKKAREYLHSIGLTQETPIFSSVQGDKLKKYVFDMLEHNYSNRADSYRLLGMLYLFLSIIAESQTDKLESPSGNTYVNHAVSYIQNHYSLPVTIEEIADYVGINRSYLSSLFKKYTGLSPIKYLQNFRLTRAEHMLRVTDLSIESIALSCGYQSSEAFHKIFKKTAQISPKEFRSLHRERTLKNQSMLRQKKNPNL